MCNSVFIQSLIHKDYDVKMTMYPKAAIDVGKIPELVKKYPNSLKFYAQSNPYFTYRLPKPSRGKADTIAILENLKKLLTDFKLLL